MMIKEVCMSPGADGALIWFLIQILTKSSIFSSL